jgi:hypothetical protein
MGSGVARFAAKMLSEHKVAVAIFGCIALALLTGALKL